MKMTRILGMMVLAAGAALPLAILPVEALARPVQSGFKADAEALLRQSFPADGPGAAVIVARRGEVLYAGARGVDGHRPITPDTVFKLGSITKQFTAAVVLQLVAEGKVSLDDPLSRFFPDFPEPGAHATVRQLLNHTSGIRDYSKIPGWIQKNGDRPHTTAELLRLTSEQGSKAPPGAEWEYNNGGYVLLGAIIEQVTGKPWYANVEDRIAGPLGLKTVAYAASDKAPRAPGQPDMSIAGAAGGLVGSVRDLARWADALHHGRVVKPALYKEMTSPAHLANGSTEPYGFGLRLRQLRGRPAFVHGGAGRGLDTDSVYIPSDDLFVAVFANSDEPATDPSVLTRRFAALALGEPFPTLAPVAVDVASLTPLFGTYKAERGLELGFFARGGKLYFSSDDREKQVFAAGGNRFFFGPDSLEWFSVAASKDGVPALAIHGQEDPAGAPEIAVRTGAAKAEVSVPAAVLQSYVGRYKTETLEVAISLEDGGSLVMTPAGKPPLPMRPLSNTEFSIQGGMMRIVFEPQGGKVDRFTMHRGARELHGQRINP